VQYFVNNIIKVHRLFHSGAETWLYQRSEINESFVFLSYCADIEFDGLSLGICLSYLFCQERRLVGNFASR